jgi:hypothetical protein
LPLAFASRPGATFANEKLGKDFLMFAEACRTRGFWRDLACNMVVPLIIALLSFRARSDFDVVLIWSVFVAAVLWFAWYALTDGYVPYTYGVPRRFTVSELNRLQAFWYVDGFIHDDPRRYTLVSYWLPVFKPGDTFFVLKHPYRNRIVWITRRSADRHGQRDRFDSMRSGPVPIYYEDFVQQP